MPDNYTELNAGQLASAANFNTVFEELDDVMGDVATLGTAPGGTNPATLTAAINDLNADVGLLADLDTAVTTSVVESINSLLAHADVSLDTDGTLKAGAVDATAVIADGIITGPKLAALSISASNIVAGTITAAQIATDTIVGANIAPGAITSSELGVVSVGTTAIINAAVTADKIAAAVAGDGLTGGAGSALAVSVDNTSIEINADALRVKTGGIVSAMIAGNTIAANKMALDAFPGSLATLSAEVPSNSSFSVVDLYLAQRRQNQVPDPLFLQLAPSRRAAGLPLFYNPQNISAYTFNQSSHPRGYGGSITYASASGGVGKYIYPGGHGFKAAAPINFYADVLIPSGVTARLACRGLDSTLTFNGTAQRSGTAVAGDGVTVVTLSVSSTVEVDSFAFAVYVAYTVGTGLGGTTIIYSLWGGQGTQSLTPDVGDDGVWLLEAARFPTTEEAFGRASLRDWRAALAKAQQGTAAAVVACVGDSWFEIDDLTASLRTLLQTPYGNAGTGWIPASSVTGLSHVAPPTGFTLTKTGTWTERDAQTDSAGVDIQHIKSTDAATPATLQLTGVMTDCYIHYLQQINGGDFRWRVDGGAWTTVATAAGAAAHATVAVTGLANASHVLDIEVTNASVAGVILMGFDTRIGTDGVRLHRLGNGGATATNYAAVDATIWQAGLTALAPNLVIILLGTNDDSGDITPTTFNTNISTMITRIRTALPRCDILLLTPGPNGLAAGTYSTDYYVNVLRSRAVADGLACLDIYLAIGNYTDGNARSLYSNTTHLNSNGTQLVADLLFERHLRVR